MCVMNHNWSATKQRLHPQTVAEISRHQFRQGNRIRQCSSMKGKEKDVTKKLFFLELLSLREVVSQHKLTSDRDEGCSVFSHNFSLE